MTETNVAYEWRDRFDNAELSALHAEAFDHHRLLEDDGGDRFIATASAGSALDSTDVSPASSTSRGTAASTRSSSTRFVSLDARREGIMQWHYIVEQSQIGLSGFGVSEINSSRNLVGLPEDIHGQISAYYSSRPAGFSTTVRNTLNGLPFQEQFQFGLDIMRRALAGDL